MRRIWLSGDSGQASAVVTAPPLKLSLGCPRSLFSPKTNQSAARFIIDKMLPDEPKMMTAGDVSADFQFRLLS